MNEPILARAQKENRRALEKVSIILENIYITTNRMLVEIQTSKSHSDKVSDRNEGHFFFWKLEEMQSYFKIQRT